MAPDVAPPHEEKHGDLRDQEATQEGLSAHDREEKEGQQTGGQAVFEPTELVAGHPILAFLEIHLCLR